MSREKVRACLRCKVVYRSRCNPYCSVACGALALKEFKDSFGCAVEVGDTQITCLVCGKKMFRTGRHFAEVHGVRGGRSERLFVLGMRQGDRLDVEDQRQAQSERNDKACCVVRPPYATIAATRTKHMLELRSATPLSNKQLDHLRKIHPIGASSGGRAIVVRYGYEYLRAIANRGRATQKALAVRRKGDSK